MRLLFRDFCLDREASRLLKGEQERHLEPKAFELLELLLVRRPQAVSIGEIQERLWPHTFISESNLTDLAAQIRRALEEEAQGTRLIRTIHGFGYAFVGEVREDSAPPPKPPSQASMAWLLWGRHALVLGPGENVLGRSEEATIQIDATGVSRLHARVVVGQGEATIEDLGSKNGTFLREVRLESPGVLHDGDSFRLGDLLLIFRFGQSGLPTATLPEASR